MTIAPQRRKACFLQILRAARGAFYETAATDKVLSKTSTSPSLSTKNLLPCFPLHPDHIRIQTPASSSSSNFKNVTISSSPTEFHSHLCTSIKNAKRRIKLATLYIGAGNGCMSAHSSFDPQKSPSREEELLQALRARSIDFDNQNKTKSAQEKLEIKILMDASRATRPIKIVPAEEKDEENQKNKDGSNCTTTSSVKEVYHALFPNDMDNSSVSSSSNSSNSSKGVALFQVLRGVEAMLPSPLNEVMGVFHLKVYIIDDELILSGANLSEEYFTDRLDRYMSFVNGANGLVDFYSDLVDVLYAHSTPYDPWIQEEKVTSSSRERNEQCNNEDSLNDALTKLFDGSEYKLFDDEDDVDKNAFAYAIPTFQPSQKFSKRNDIQIPKDVNVIRDMILTVKENYKNSSLFISSAYLNPTPLLMSAIETYLSKPSSNSCVNNVYLLSAAPKSHGFKPKKKDHAINGSGRGWIPSIFMKLAQDVHDTLSINGGKVLLYEREGHTFHAKGLWLTSSSSLPSSDYHTKKEKKIKDPENNLLVSVIGSSNYGSRSEILDFESNCILVINPMANDTKSNIAKIAIAGDWNMMLERHVEYGSRSDLRMDGESSSSAIKSFARSIVTEVVRRFF